LIALFRQFFSNLFHIGAIQLTTMLLQFYLIALVISRVGIATNGLVLTALSLAWLACILLNYAGNQTIPLVFAKEQSGVNSRQAAEDAAEVVTDNLSVRLLFFLVAVLVILIVYFMGVPFGIYLLGAIPILFSELINPQAFYLSLNKMQFFNLANLVGRSLGVGLVWYTLYDVADAPWANAWVGIGLSIAYLFLWLHLVATNIISFAPVSSSRIKKMLVHHFPLVGANVVVQLQQSVFLYALGLTANPVVLGAYSIVDRITSGVRNILIAFSNAIFPLSIKTMNEDSEAWLSMRKKLNDFLFVSLMVMGFAIWFFAETIAQWFSKGIELPLITAYIKWLAPIPFIIGINALNVIELLVKKQFKAQFNINIILMCSSILITALFIFALKKTDNNASFCTGVFCLTQLLPTYLLITEGVNLFLYEKYRRSVR
jgi:O-antigen/teichoic acid export membrane protein